MRVRRADSRDVWLSSRCRECSQDIVSTSGIYQMARGVYRPDGITPMYGRDPVLGEWRQGCLDVARLVGQCVPYRCDICRAPVNPGSPVIYLTGGKKPTLGYRRPESRGYQLLFILHESCSR